jgi:alkylresorcinol/alkylpyrone synthase
LNAIDVTATPTATAGQPQTAKQWAREPAQGRANGHRPALGPRIAGLAVSDSDTTLTQREVLDRLGLTGDDFAERIFAHSRIDRRHLQLDDEFLARTTQGRAHAVEDQLLRHSVHAIDGLGAPGGDALAHGQDARAPANGRPRATFDPARVGSVVSASLYSLGLPTLAHRLAEHYQLDPTVDKYHVTGVGCASAVPLMRMAAGVMQQHPGRDSVIVAAESMSSILMRGGEEDPRAKTVGSAIFGDGCAAALLSHDPDADGPAIVATQVHQIGGTLGAVALSFAPDDSYLHLARELPDLAGAGLPGVVDGFLREHHVTHAEIDHWIVHPGGRRIIENAQRALALTDEQIELAWETLANHGNVGTPSIFYVLRDTIARRNPQAGERGLAVTIGPGVTVGLMLLQW